MHFKDHIAIHRKVGVKTSFPRPLPFWPQSAPPPYKPHGVLLNRRRLSHRYMLEYTKLRLSLKAEEYIHHVKNLMHDVCLFTM